MQKAIVTYQGSVEGLQEELYFKHLQNLINSSDEFSKRVNFKAIVPVSALRSTNLDDLKKLVFESLPEGQHCFSEDSITDRSSRFMAAELIREKLMRAAVVQSLTRIEGVNAVAFTVDGNQLMDRNGIAIGLMNEDDFVETTASSPSAYQTDTLTLYFANETGDKLVAEKTDVRYSSNVSKDKLIVEKLMQGPDEAGAYPTINPDTNLLSVTIKDGICYVNFDSAFLTGAYDVLPEVTVYSIVNSLIEGTEAGQVQITINGETNAEYMDAVDLSQPLSENRDLLAVKDDE